MLPYFTPQKSPLFKETKLRQKIFRRKFFAFKEPGSRALIATTLTTIPIHAANDLSAVVLRKQAHQPCLHALDPRHPAVFAREIDNVCNIKIDASHRLLRCLTERNRCAWPMPMCVADACNRYAALKKCGNARPADVFSRCASCMSPATIMSTSWSKLVLGVQPSFARAFWLLPKSSSTSAGR